MVMSEKNSLFFNLNVQVVLEKVIILVMVPPETESETRMQVQTDELEGDARKHLDKVGDVSQARKGSP